ncbi:MAG: preprotein translocase subunit SecD [Pseudomonadota bacterium]|jgi:preprotein translocase subunit SecD
MMHFGSFKAASIVITCLLATIFALPNLFKAETVAKWPNWVPKNQIALGLDLRGGAHILLSMDTDALMADWLKKLRQSAAPPLRQAKIAFKGVGLNREQVTVRLAKAEDIPAAIKVLKPLANPIGNALLGTGGDDIDVVEGPGNSVIIRPNQPGIQHRISGAISASLETIRRRIDSLGTSEPVVVRQGIDRILVQFPGLSDTKRLKALIGETAQLNFHDVGPEVYAQSADQRVPAGFKIYPSGEREGERGTGFYILQEVPVVAGEELVDAQPGFDSRTNEPVINFRFNQSGARKFGRYTQNNVGRPFAIVLDGKVISAPNIREPILGGSGQISGSFTPETAKDLAIQLRSGALPAPLTVVEERTVGPSLGADSIRAGTTAFFWGVLGTVLLTIFMYGTFGVFSVIGLVLNGIMIVALMSVVGTTLTLPGIAGLVLTIGMAVDANVLIYERIREELRSGKAAINAIEAGFGRAMVTIMDSQLTTLAAALIMFWLGSGPIRGFAVTLSIGIFTSIFTAVTVVRLIVATWLHLERSKSRNVEVPI